MFCNWKHSVAASLVVLAGLSGTAVQALAAPKLQATNRTLGNSLQVDAGSAKKPIHLDAVGALGTANGARNGNTGVGPKIQIDKNPTMPLNSGVGNGLGGLIGKPVDPKFHLGGQTGKVGKIDTQIPGNIKLGNHTPGSGNLKLDPNLVGKFKPNKPIDPGFNAKFKDAFCGNVGKKCQPFKPWNPWCGAWLPWYPCYPCFDPCDPCCHWHPTHTIIYIECLPVYVCDPLYVVQPVVIVEGQEPADLELLDVRLIDSGLPQEKLGPGYRVLVRNNSGVDVTLPFQVTLLATLGDEPTTKSPRGMAEIEHLAAGKTTVVDIRLPLESLALGQTPTGDSLAFTRLVSVVDSRQQLPEVNEKNNASSLLRQEIAPVQPHILGFDRAAQFGNELVVLGEGFGDQPGAAYLMVGGLKLKLETKGWMTHALRLTLPELTVAESADLNLQVLRADGEISQPAAVPAANGE